MEIKFQNLKILIENKIGSKDSQLGIRVLAHDIKNIFNNISSSIELTKIFSSESTINSKVSEQFNIINGQIARGIQLISNVRILSELNGQSRKKTSMNVSNQLEDAITLVKKVFQDKTININVNSFSKEIFATVDELISEVFENLLFNAVLHNMNNIVDIFILINEEQKADKKYLKFEFKDNGIGLSDNRKEWIFDESLKKGKTGKGKGYGLTLVSKVIETYGGLIWVEDRVKGDYSQGTNFLISIPLRT